MAAILNSAMLNSAILDSAILVFILNLTQHLPRLVPIFNSAHKKLQLILHKALTQTNSIWLRAVFEFWHSTWIHDTAILDSDTSCINHSAQKDFTQKHSHSTWWLVSQTLILQSWTQTHSLLIQLWLMANSILNSALLDSSHFAQNSDSN